MTSTLHEDLIEAGYTPEPVPIDGDVAWTGWHAPLQKDTYEIYYDFCTGAMYAQAELPPWDRPHGLRSLPIYRRLMEEYTAVVDCWRSASQVPPAPEAR